MRGEGRVRGLFLYLGVCGGYVGCGCICGVLLLLLSVGFFMFFIVDVDFYVCLV